MMNGFISERSESIEVNYSREDVINSINEGINKLDGMKVENIDKVMGHIVVKTSMSLFSWGESIHIAISESNNGTLIQISSAPKVGSYGMANLDMGKNRKNIERIISKTSEILKLKTPIDKNNKLNNETIKERLLKLKKLLDNNLIDEDDYNKRKEAILSEI